MDSPTAKELLDRYYLEMRWRVLSLASDLDRIQRAVGGEAVIASDERIARLRACISELHTDQPDRAERVQLSLSDKK